jgi:hypothetical protein
MFGGKYAVMDFMTPVLTLSCKIASMPILHNQPWETFFSGKASFANHAR